MTTAIQLTADNLLAMPDEGRGYELINGELREKLVSQEASYIAAEIRAILREHVLSRGLGVLYQSDVGFQCFNHRPEQLRRPDVAFIERSRITADSYHSRGFCRVVPDLVVEVISPNESNDTVHDKREDWTSAGVSQFWLVDPRDETIRVYVTGQRPQLFTSVDTITVEPLMPGFICQVAEFFKSPPLADR